MFSICTITGNEDVDHLMKAYLPGDSSPSPHPLSLISISWGGPGHYVNILFFTNFQFISGFICI